MVRQQSAKIAAKNNAIEEARAAAMLRTPTEAQAPSKTDPSIAYTAQQLQLQQTFEDARRTHAQQMQAYSSRQHELSFSRELNEERLTRLTADMAEATLRHAINSASQMQQWYTSLTVDQRKEFTQAEQARINTRQALQGDADN